MDEREQKSPACAGLFGQVIRTAYFAGAPLARRPAKTGHAVMSTSLVSGRKISATTKLIVAMMIGYHSPE
jgi:hypothetical protein